jgi:hypothetical protein
MMVTAGMDCSCSREMEVLKEMSCNMLVDYQGKQDIHFKRHHLRHTYRIYHTQL